MKLHEEILKTATIMVTVLIMTSISIMAVPVQAQTTAHGGQPVAGYEGPTTVPSGQTPDFTISSLAFLSVSPNPIGVGQELLINVWTTFPSGEGKYQVGYVVRITKPDGTIEDVNLKSYVADGTSWFTYVPQQVGTWKFRFNFLGEWFPAGYYMAGQYSTSRTGAFSNAIYNPSVYVTPAEAAPIDLIVQSEYVISWHSPLPTDYWTRPIEPNNREWNEIGGNYPWTQSIISGADGQISWDDEWYGPVVKAPSTPHIVWKTIGELAGIIGGETGQYSRISGPRSQGIANTPSVIYMGKCYATYVRPGVGSVAGCYDLRTGEIFYEIPTASGGVTPTRIAYWSPTSSSVVPGAEASNEVTVELNTISGGRLFKINPLTGAVTANVSLPPGLAGTAEMWYRNGYYLSYRSFANDVMNPAPNVTTTRSTTGFLVNWSTQGSSSNFTTRIVSNITVTIPNSLRTLYQTGGYGSLGAFDPDSGITVVQDRFIYGGYYGSNFWAVNLKTGQMLWNISTPVSKMESAYRPTNAWCRNGRYIAEMERGYLQARDLYTGKVLWESEMKDNPWAEFWMYDEAAYNDIIMGVGYTGVWAFNETNGNIIWHYIDPAIPFETPYNTANGTISCNVVETIRVADGKVYVSNEEHSASQPATRGWGLSCLDVETGKKLWKIMGTRMDPGPAADGYMVCGSDYDGYMYVLGKGKSKTTVAAPLTSVAKGTGVLITGTVVDTSPAAPNTPCIADENMDTWMDYLHLQMPVDGIYHNITVKGVPVTVVATDSSGTSVTIGTATSDTSGTFKIAWQPPAEGEFTITAIFSGSDSYGSSTATTGMLVGPPPSTSNANGSGGNVNPQIDYTWTIIGVGIAVIIAVAIATILILGKR